VTRLPPEFLTREPGTMSFITDPIARPARIAVQADHCDIVAKLRVTCQSPFICDSPSAKYIFSSSPLDQRKYSSGYTGSRLSARQCCHTTRESILFFFPFWKSPNWTENFVPSWRFYLHIELLVSIAGWDRCIYCKKLNPMLLV